MLAILYLILAFFVGRVIKQLFRIDTTDLFARISGRTNHLPPVWTFDFPFFLIVGVTIVTTLHYYLSYLFSFLLPDSVNPLLASNISMVPLMAVFFFLSYRNVIRKSEPLKWRRYFTWKDSFYWKMLFCFAYFSVFLIFFSFFVNKGYLNSGATVFSDFAPHTAMISSFAKGWNFPTQYPHFAGEGIQYHFMFFYLCGNLEFLGLRIDFAMNIPSILGILSFTLLLGCLGVLLTRRKWVFFLAPFMLFFRSSYAIFTYLQELVSKSGATAGSVLLDVLFTSKFIGQTMHDDWGLWSMNVYANQRHFLWGFSILLLILFLFIPLIFTVSSRHHDSSPANGSVPAQDTESRSAHTPKFPIFSAACVKILYYLRSKDLWKVKDPLTLLLCLLLIVCLPYWHGSVLIALLCILFVMAFFSVSRISYLAMAASGVLSAVLQARFFSGDAGNVASPSFFWGFLSADTSLFGVLGYLFQVLGISFLLLFVLPLLQKRFPNRVILFSCLSPIIFALCISLTPDITVNHKYVIIAMALLNIFIADAFCLICSFLRDSKRSFCKEFQSIFKNNGLEASIPRRRTSRIFALPAKLLRLGFSFLIVLFLSFSLFATGIPELTAYVNKNIATVKVDLDSPITAWIEKNTEPDAIFLTAPYHMNAFFFSGRKIFFGWPYYSWSAGYDTASREDVVSRMFLGYDGDLDAFMKNVRSYGIRYIIIDDTLLTQTDYLVDTSFFDENFSIAASFPSIQNTRIYKLY